VIVLSVAARKFGNLNSKPGDRPAAGLIALHNIPASVLTTWAFPNPEGRNTKFQARDSQQVMLPCPTDTSLGPRHRQNGQHTSLIQKLPHYFSRENYFHNSIRKYVHDPICKFILPVFLEQFYVLRLPFGFSNYFLVLSFDRKFAFEIG
jgi:hypothetical protein